jgi:hypothetical protein
MKKRAAAFLLAAVMCLGLAACGGSGSDVNTIEKDSSKAEASSAEAAPSEEAQAPEEAAVGTGYVYTLTYKDASIDVTPDQNMAEVLAALGDADSYFEAASCAFEGLDKTYMYGHVEVDTYPQGEEDFISSIYFLDDLAVTNEGVRVGSTKEEMEAAYGTDYSVVGTECIYAKGNSELRIIVEGDKVSSIQIVSTNVPDVAEGN